jgi:ribosomal subunit interface protein
MPFRISGKNIELGEALRDRVDARVKDALGKFFDGGYSGHVTVGREAFGFHTECVVHLDSGIMLRADSMAADAYLSADQAAEKLEKRLRRYHRRLKDHRAESRRDGRDVEVSGDLAASYVIAALDDDADAKSDAFSPVIVAETTTAFRRLSVSDAVIELDMTGASVVVFRHAGHGRVNIVYRRADGNIGWIDPPAASNA